MDTVNSIQQFIQIILGRPSADRWVTTYRGHANKEFKLQPSIFRKTSNQENEHIILRELVAAHPEDFAQDNSALELLVRMQHYSLPTRLLDVSTNPLVALYFACESVKKRIPVMRAGGPGTRTVEAEAEVVVLRVPREKMRYFDSDTVRCLTNLARLSWEYKSQIRNHLSKLDFNETIPAKRLLHFIKQESNGFLPEINPKHLSNVYLVKPKQNNKRILAQAGSFFAFGLTEVINDDNDYGIEIERISIDPSSKSKILNSLDKLGLNEKTLFPEIDRAARYITGSITVAPATL